MIDAMLETATQLRGNAQDYRRKGREESDSARRNALFHAATEEFRKAIVSLERGLRALRRQRNDYSTEVCRVLEALSQSCGSMGGTYRDAGNLERAREYYDKGNGYEEERRRNCGAKDTYNMLQRLIIRLLINPGLLDDEGFVAELKGVGEEIDRQRLAGRDDSWALADAVLVEFLSGADAEKAIDDLESGQAGAPFYESTFNVVAALVAEGLGKGHELGRRLEAFKGLLQRKGGLASEGARAG